MKTNILHDFIFFILRKTDTVDDVLSGIVKYQKKLVVLAERLRQQAVLEEEEARKKFESAKLKSAEAERAVTVANRFTDLTS